MKNLRITQREMSRVFAREARRVGLKPSELPRPTVDCRSVSWVCRHLRIYRVYVVNLWGYLDPISGLPEVYIGKTRMETSHRVEKFISHMKRNPRYTDLYNNTDFDVLYGGLTDDEAKAVEMKVIKAVRESRMWCPLNKSKGGESGSRYVKRVFLSAVIGKYIRNIRTDMTIYRLYGADFDTTRVLLPHEVVDASIKEILKNPRHFIDIRCCVDEVAQEWESKNKRITPGRSNGEPLRVIDKIMDYLAVHFS